MHTAIYIRVSSDKQYETGYSYEEQERILREFCATQGYPLAGVYGDGGISGKDIEHRDGLLNLLSDSKKGKFSRVVVWKIARFARSMKDLMSILDDFDKRNISVESYTEKWDTSTASGKLVRNMLGVIAEFDRDVISENVRMSYVARTKKGQCRPVSILGYNKIGKYGMEINQTEAAIVKFMFYEYIKLKNINRLSDSANRQGYVGKFGRAFTPSSCSVILKNPTYCGYFVSKGRLVIPAIPFEPIIPTAVFNRVQQILTSHPNSRTRRKALFTL